MVKLFTFLWKQAVDGGFRFPGGSLALKTVSAGLDSLRRSAVLSDERMVDFCVCQAYAVSRFGKAYLTRWKPAHSFGKKARERFSRETRASRYHEDAWLKAAGISRKELLGLIKSKRKHPQARFVYPSYEDGTKARALGTQAGYYICGVSTLLWTPLSPVCRRCPKAGACEERTKLAYPELYRLRKEEPDK